MAVGFTKSEDVLGYESQRVRAISELFSMNSGCTMYQFVILSFAE